MLLLLLATAITANLAGLFELPVLGGRMQPAGGFATGALAAFVATPCAGPFLGAALGTALLLPIEGAVLVFAALGFGLALPFLLVAFAPSLRKLLPKPGPWMQKFQRILAIPMALTALACLWLLYRVAGTLGSLVALGLVATVLLWLAMLGAAQRGGRRPFAFKLSALVVSALLFVALAFDFPVKRSTEATASIGGNQRWSEQAVAAELKQGKPVFVYFTADWCLTCKANEAAAIDRAEVRDAFKAGGVKTLVGDWTNGDPEITRFLESRSRAGVPLYLWYEPGRDAEELPQILTPSMLISRARQPRR
jgi:thiol:disulfide interchange protein